MAQHSTHGGERPRVLLMVYYADPERGSEPGVGWNRAVEAAKYCDTWVITCKEASEGPVLNHLDRYGPIPGLSFVFVDRTRLHKLASRLGPLKYFGYRIWQRQALSVARRLHKQFSFDLVHHVNYVGFREPGYAWKLDAPFVWGPIGGTQNYPLRFLKGAGLRVATRELVRNLLNRAQLRFSHRVRRALKRASPLLTANATISNDIKRAKGPDSTIMLETGVKKLALARSPKVESRKELRIIWSGEMKGMKALEVLLEAVARLPSEVDWQLRILGDGPMRGRWQRLANRLGLDERVHWLGWLPHAKAMAQFKWADLFAFTSLRDTTGTVLLESLAFGIPILCFDHQGAGQVVTPKCGIKIPVISRSAAISGFRNALVELANDRQRLIDLSNEAHLRARQFTWNRLGEQMAEVYEQVLKRNGKDFNLQANGQCTDGSTDRGTQVVSGALSSLEDAATITGQ